MVCDICGDRDLDTNHWVISGPGSQRSLDLCEQHAEPLTAFFDQVAPKRRDTAAMYQPVTLEEIEAKKRSGQA